MNKENIEKIVSETKNYDEIVDKLNAEGIKINKNDFVNLMNSKRELSDDELSVVTGGCSLISDLATITSRITKEIIGELFKKYTDNLL